MKKRMPTVFENFLFIIGVLAIGIGYFFVHVIITNYGLFVYESAVAMMLWFGLILIIILIAVNENSKEELKIIIRQQHDEIKLLRDDLRRKR